MGVTGLWKLIEQTGKPVPLETLENKVLAIDISIWLHQVVKGFQDASGAALPHAHLLGLFHRLCKLLYYRIKPIFVFDGGVPHLKRETIRKRHQNKRAFRSEADRLQQLLLESLAREKIVQQALGEDGAKQLSPRKDRATKPELATTSKDDLFKLPPIKEAPDRTSSSIDLTSDSDSSYDEKNSRHHYNVNLQSIDVNSRHFQSLPADVRHEILTDMKEKRKESSWGRLHELPAESDDFSEFQMKRLLKRRQVQVSLEDAEKEMGGKSLSLGELEQMLKEEGVVDDDVKAGPSNKNSIGDRIVSDENTRYLHVRDLKKALRDEEEARLLQPSPTKRQKMEEDELPNGGDHIEDEDLRRAIQMSLEECCDPEVIENVSNDRVKLRPEQKKILGNAVKSLAKAYMVEYGGLNSEDVDELVQPDIDDDVLESTFKYNDVSVLKGHDEEALQFTDGQNNSDEDDDLRRAIQLSLEDCPKRIDEPAIQNPDVEKSTMDEDDDVSSSADSEFIDVPEADSDMDSSMTLREGMRFIPQYGRPPSPSMDFRHSDLKLAMSTESKRLLMEVVIKPDASHDVNDDLFADVFGKIESSEGIGLLEKIKEFKDKETGKIEVKLNAAAAVEEKPKNSKISKDIINDLDAQMDGIERIRLNDLIIPELTITEASSSSENSSCVEVLTNNVLIISSPINVTTSGSPKEIASVEISASPKTKLEDSASRSPSLILPSTSRELLEPSSSTKSEFETLASSQTELKISPSSKTISDSVLSSNPTFETASSTTDKFEYSSAEIKLQSPPIIHSAKDILESSLFPKPELESFPSDKMETETLSIPSSINDIQTGTESKLKLPKLDNLNSILESLNQEITNLNEMQLDSIILPTKSEAVVEDGEVQLKTSSQDIIGIDDDQLDQQNKIKQTSLNSYFDVQVTPTKKVARPESPVTPKVPSPFFRKKTPSSKKKSPPDDSSPRDHSNVSKSLFPDSIQPPEQPKTDAEKTADYSKEAASILRQLKSQDELTEMASDTRQATRNLQLERNRHDRLGMSITERMNDDCKYLLELFGVPYVVAPMEAEAQCAFFDSVKLTDGTITDDSDIWLFGGQTVYKHFFNQAKLVQEFRADTVERVFNVERAKLIQLAMLVGSDYTTGVAGIGAVTALEILASFNTTPEKAGETTKIMSMMSALRKFKEWWTNSRNAGPKAGLRKKLKNIQLTEDFPSIPVVEAYLNPVVNDDMEPFTWGLPDAETIREYAKNTFGWTYSKTDDVLQPVLKKLAEKKSQASIRDYFRTGRTFIDKEVAVSKRVRQAINKMGAAGAGDSDTGEAEKKPRKTRGKKNAEMVENDPETKKKRSTKRKAAEDIDKNEASTSSAAVNGGEDQEKAVKPKRKAVKRKQTENQPSNETKSISPPSNSSDKMLKGKVPKVPDFRPPIKQRENDKEEFERNKLKAIKVFKAKENEASASQKKKK